MGQYPGFAVASSPASAEELMPNRAGLARHSACLPHGLGLAAALTFLLLFTCPARGQSITTYAGGGTDDGRLATSVSFSLPTGITVDAQGNLYLADRNDHRVRRVDAVTELVSTVAGSGANGFSGDGGLATKASLRNPTDVAVDSDGNVYIADRENHRIRRVDGTTGIINTIAGVEGPEYHPIGDGGPAIEASLLGPNAIVLDRAMHLYIADHGHHRVRRLDLTSGIIMTVAGSGAEGFSGDGGPADEAALDHPSGVALDDNGNLFIVDEGNNRVRKVDSVSGVIETYAGNGEFGFSGDGGPATEAMVALRAGDFDLLPKGIALNDEGDLFLADYENGRIRRVDSSGTISTVAGDGEWNPLGDGGPATESNLRFPTGLVFDTAGDLLISDTRSYRIRRVDSSTRVIDTIAGDGMSGFTGDGGTATQGAIRDPRGVGLDSQGNLYIADQTNFRIRRVDRKTGLISTIAGTGFWGPLEGDGGPATEANLDGPSDVAFDREGHLYIADSAHDVIRKVGRNTGIITTVAGNGEEGFAGDGGVATEASMFFPGSIDIDRSNRLFIADQANYRIRMVDLNTGIITTIAGTGEFGHTGDGGPATEAALGIPHALVADEDGNVWFTSLDPFGMEPVGANRIRRVDAVTGVITTVVGTGDDGFYGDGGAATQAAISFPQDVALDSDGNLFIADTNNHLIRRVDGATGFITTVAGSGLSEYQGDLGPAVSAGMAFPVGLAVGSEGSLYIAVDSRVRKVSPCIEIEVSVPTSPAEGSTGTALSPTLSWRPVEGAFSYDVLLDTIDPPTAILASDLKGTEIKPQNLEQATTYYWRVVAKGDPFCLPRSIRESAVRRFTTRSICNPPGAPSLLGPQPDEEIAGTSVVLQWSSPPGTGSYDLYFGPSDPPPFYRSTLASSIDIQGLISGTRYSWSVVARAGCDPTLTSSYATRSFLVSGDCLEANEFETVYPTNGQSDVTTRTRLAWTGSSNASGYDLFLGTTNPPQLFLSGLNDTELILSGLLPDVTYHWNVRANVACDAALSRTTAVSSFTTLAICEAPEASEILLFPPPVITLGRTYAMSWSDAEGLDPSGRYVIERSSDDSFQTILDSRETSTTSAGFIADELGVLHHRVRPVMGCDPEVVGPDSEIVSLTVIEPPATVVFTREPGAVISPPGEKLEDLRASFAIENIGTESVEVRLIPQRLDSPPFFRIVDPLGGRSDIVTLEPRKPRTFDLRFSGPPNDLEASYQGLILASVAGSDNAPYAFVNLRIGNRAAAAAEVRVGGTETGYAFFPGWRGDDRDRPPIIVEIHNPGAEPMDLAAEIGPEVWLEPEPGWNDQPVPANGTREVRLFTRRKRAINGSALPRYTYFTVRAGTGAASRLLVQDNDATALGATGRRVAGPNEVSFLVPELVSETIGTVDRVSVVRLTNPGADPVQAELFFTPEGHDGFSDAVRNATVIVPANDIVMLTDPIVQIFGLDRPARGQLEIRSARSNRGLLGVSASVVSGDRVTEELLIVPIFRRGDGARAGSPQGIAGIDRSSTTNTDLVLVETTGTEAVQLQLHLLDSDGVSVGSLARDLPRYGYIRVEDLVVELGGASSLSGGQLRIEVDEGGGAVAAIAILESADRHGSTIRGAPLASNVEVRTLGHSKRRTGQVETTTTLAASWVASGDVENRGIDYATVMGFQTPFSKPKIDFDVTFTGSNGTVSTRTVSVLAGICFEIPNVIRDLFGIDSAIQGSMKIAFDPAGHAYARLQTNGLPASTLELVSLGSELVSSTKNARALFVDGLEQSIDPEQGSRWNLHVQEVRGSSGRITLRMFEAGNRSTPIAQKSFNLEPHGQLNLETIFASMGLEEKHRLKTRTNVLLVLTPESGASEFAAVATEIDNVSGRVSTHQLKPASGLSGTGITTGLVRVVEPDVDSTRQRSVRRP